MRGFPMTPKRLGEQPKVFGGVGAFFKKPPRLNGSISINQRAI
jgi:hypothetical protein